MTRAGIAGIIAAGEPSLQDQIQCHYQPAPSETEQEAT
jgi:hypothetical protein